MLSGQQLAFEMQQKRGKPMSMSEFSNSLILDMKSLSNSLRPLSKILYESNNRILNELLSSKDDQINDMLLKVLTHTLQIVQYRDLISHTLSLLNKCIICVKTFPAGSRSLPQKQATQTHIGFMLDVLIASSTQNADNQDISLRILQTAFSLIDHTLICLFDEKMISRMLSICFGFCKTPNIVQNISVSALFAFVETLFKFGDISECFNLLTSFLEFLFEGKKFIWIKSQVKGLVWDLIVIGVKNFSPNHITGLQHCKKCQELLNKMYQIICNSIFLKTNKQFYNVVSQNLKQNNISKSQLQRQSENISEFLRYFKAYVAISTSLSIQSYRVIDKQFIPFRASIPKLMLVCDLQRNSRMFILLQAICKLLLDAYEMPLSLEKGMVFIEVISKISEELCLNNQPIKVNWDHNEQYIDKIVNQEPKVTDGDFVRLIKNTIIQLRCKFQKDDNLIKCKQNKKIEPESARSTVSTLPQKMSNSKRWQIFIKNIIRIIRYMSSINFVNNDREQDPTRKFILQLQYWFLLCPVFKAKNMVLQQLLITANVLNNKMQAIKVSQSVQIGSNILYGYYDDLDSMGLTIILKMMAGVKADWEEGKSFQELDQIYNLCNNIFQEQKLVHSDTTFTMTIQALVQCANSLIADTEQPKQKSAIAQLQLNSIKRSYKMIDYLIQRLIIVVNNNPKRAAADWNFITVFFITLCFNKNPKIKEEGIKSIGILVKNLLKADLGKELDRKKQLDILGLYLELAKEQGKQIQGPLVEQLKAIMPRIQEQSALMNGFRVVKILSQNPKNSKQMIANIHELQEIIIKECLHKVTQVKYLKMILDGLTTRSAEKNQQYRLINLMWSVSDYFRKITPSKNISEQFIQLWDSLFKNLWLVCQNSKQLETKQSAIHTMTQILAQSVSFLSFDFVILIISKYYHQMVLLLLGIHSSSLADTQKSPQTAKVALKNYVRIFKKLTTIENKSQQDQKEIARNLSQINGSITKYIEKHIQSQNSGSISLELIYQLLIFISQVQEDKGFQQYGVKDDLKKMFEAILELLKICEQVVSPKIDLKSHMYKKKVTPLIQKITQFQNKDKETKKINGIDGKQEKEEK